MIEAEEIFFEERNTEQENNVIELPRVVNKLKIVTFWDSEKKVYGALRNPAHQLQLMDLALAAFNDYVLADLIKQISGAEIPQKGLSRDWALAFINNLNEQARLQIAQNIVIDFIKDYNYKIIFLLDGNEIISVFAFSQNEKGFSLKAELALRGTLTQRQRAILYWNKNKNNIFKQLHSRGYKRLYMVALSERERLIKVIMRGEGPEIFQSNKMLETGKYNNKIMPYKEYMLNLGAKFKHG